MIKKIKAVMLIEDFDLYPRSQVDGTEVAEITEAMRAGIAIPPLIIDQKSLRIIDGFHRRRAAIHLYGDNAEVECDLRHYESEKDMYLDAVKYNRNRGKDITGSELTGAILKAMKLDISVEDIAKATKITVERCTEIVTQKAVKVMPRGSLIALKGSVRHMSGKAVSSAQADVIASASGTTQWLLIKQLNDLIEVGLIDYENEKVVSELSRLYRNLNALSMQKTIVQKTIKIKKAQ